MPTNTAPQQTCLVGEEDLATTTINDSPRSRMENRILLLQVVPEGFCGAHSFANDSVIGPLSLGNMAPQLNLSNVLRPHALRTPAPFHSGSILTRGNRVGTREAARRNGGIVFAAISDPKTLLADLDAACKEYKRAPPSEVHI